MKNPPDLFSGLEKLFYLKLREKILQRIEEEGCNEYRKKELKEIDSLLKEMTHEK